MSSYALVIANAVQSEGGLPTAARRLDTGGWVLGLREASVALQQATGHFEVVDVAKPADTATNTFDRTVTLVSGVPTVTWTSRPMTADELAGRTATTNSVTLRQRASDALAANVTYLAIGTPSNAQVAAQVRALTQQASALIRLQLGALEATT